MPRVSLRNSLTSDLVPRGILFLHEILITSAPDKYAPIIKSLNPVICSQQSIAATFFDALD